MANFWLPGDSNFALALREPNLLVPEEKPVGNVVAKKHLNPKAVLLFRPGEGSYDITGRKWIDLGGSPGYGYRTEAAALSMGAQGDPIKRATFYGLTSSSSASLQNSDSDLVNLPNQPFTVSWLATQDSAAQSAPAIAGWDGADDIVFYHSRSTNSNSPAVFWRDNGGIAVFGSATYINLYNWCLQHFVSDGTGSIYLYSNGTLISSYSGSMSGVGPFTSVEVGAWTSQAAINTTLAFFGVFGKAFTPEETAEHSRNIFSFVCEPANQSPFLIGVTAGGTNYDETFTASASADLALANTWSLNYAETFTASAASDLSLTDEYASPSINYDETFTASASSALELTDSWELNYTETFAAGAVADLALTDAWALDYAETFIASSVADLSLSDSYAVGNNYAESFSASAVADLSLTDVWVPNYTETFTASASSDLALTETWQLDYAETFAASAIAELLLSDTYDSPAPGAFDETFFAASFAQLSLYNTFTTPNALPVGISALTAERLSGIVAKLIN